jgi:hypothetical protein
MFISITSAFVVLALEVVVLVVAMVVVVVAMVVVVVVLDIVVVGLDLKGLVPHPLPLPLVVACKYCLFGRLIIFLIQKQEQIRAN